MNNMLTKFDSYLSPSAPAALVIREHLMPVEGKDGVFFPATYADIGYNIDGDTNGKNVALIDSVGSQANRIEPMFAEPPYDTLVPQIVISAGEKRVNLLEVGHRAGDAIARCSSLKQELQDAFKAVLSGNAMPLAKIAPTSLVFGVWDSRDTQAKLPRLIASTIRAYNVRKLTRSAQYNPAMDYSTSGVISEEDRQKAEGNAKDPLAQRGFVHVPAIGAHGGVIAEGGIRRDATLALAALRLLSAETEEDSLKLRRYILGLALVSFTKLPLGYLRQGAILVCDPDQSRTFDAVTLDGKREPIQLTHEDALKFAKAAAQDFVIGENKQVEFNSETAKTEIRTASEKKNKKGGNP